MPNIKRGLTSSTEASPLTFYYYLNEHRKRVQMILRKINFDIIKISYLSYKEKYISLLLLSAKLF